MSEPGRTTDGQDDAVVEPSTAQDQQVPAQDEVPPGVSSPADDAAADAAAADASPGAEDVPVAEHEGVDPATVEHARAEAEQVPPVAAGEPATSEQAPDQPVEHATPEQASHQPVEHATPEQASHQPVEHAGAGQAPDEQASDQPTEQATAADAPAAAVDSPVTESAPGPEPVAEAAPPMPAAPAAAVDPVDSPVTESAPGPEPVAEAAPPVPAAPAAVDPVDSPVTESAPGPEPVVEATPPVPAAPAPAPPAPAAGAPAPSPAPRPGAPRPGTPRPGAPRPGASRPGAPGRAGVRPGGGPSRPGGRPGRAPQAPTVTATQAPADTAQWGRVDDEGVVHVRTPEGERVVGSYPDATPEEALAYFGRRFADLVAQADLVEQRLTVPDVPVGELRSSLAKVSRALTDASAVGDLAALAARLGVLGGEVTELERAANHAREEARSQVRATRTALVEEAEALAEADPEKVQWKASGERMRAMFDDWRTQQREAGTARLPKNEEDELWRRLKHARNRFERHRRHHFAELDQRHTEARGAKERLIAEAEALSTSTDWGPTSVAYRELMDRWKAAPRASRKDDDALWARFRAAQDVFFGARNAKDSEQDSEQQANLEVKEALLVEAEAILPVRDVRAATAALREVQDRWDDAGKVPRADLGRVEKRMRAVEQAVRDADSDRWRRTNPEARARAEGALGQLQDSITDLETELEQARANGDERTIARAQEALDARRAWLEQVERAAADFGG